MPVVHDFPIILGHDVPEAGLVRKRHVHVTLRAAAALFPHGARAGRSETVRVSGQLKPRLLLLLMQDGGGGGGGATAGGGGGDGGGGAAGSARLSGGRSNRGLLLVYDAGYSGSISGRRGRRRPVAVGTTVVAQEYVAGRRAQFQCVLRMIRRYENFNNAINEANATTMW